MLISSSIFGSLNPINIASGFPGQPSNPVGYAASPGFSSLTVYSGFTLTSGTSGSPHVYSFLDFQSGTTAVTLSGLTWVTFVGCRFQSNAAGAWPASSSKSNVIVNGSTNISFSYCSFTPLTSFATSNPGLAWPASNAGVHSTTQVPGTNSISELDAYTYGLLIESGGPVTVDHCDFWGFGNVAIDFSGTTAQMTISSSWLHDGAAHGSTYSQHQDAIGYLNGGTAVQNVLIENCTIAGLGNTNAVAFQGSNTTAYSNIVLTGNYVSGFGYTVTLPGGTNGGWTNGAGTSTTTGTLIFSNNTFGTDIAWVFGPLFANYTTNFTSSTWFGNTLNVLPGTSPMGSAFPVVNWTVANTGNFVWPDWTLHTTDFT